MNTIQSLIDRQLGIYCRLSYDGILKRLVVDGAESFYGLQATGAGAPDGPGFEQDPPIFACRFAEASGYEHILALANEDGRVAIQDTSSGRSAQQLQSFPCHNNAVFDLAWMPHTMNFVTVSGDHTASLWDLSGGAPQRVRVFSQHSRSVKTLAFRPAEPWGFATGARDGHVLVWDARASASAPAIVLKPDNCLMNCHSSFTPKAGGSHGKRARIEPRAASVTGLAFRDATTLLSCGERDGNVKVWDLRKNYSLCRREPLPKHAIPYCGSSARTGYSDLTVDEAGVRLYASCMDGVIYCFNVSTYGATPERRYVGHENATFYIKTSLSPDGAYLVSGSSDKSAYVWNVKSSRPLVRLTGHRAEVTCAAWCRRGDPKLVTCSDDAHHKIWRIGREFLDPDDEPKGRAEAVPRGDVALPEWGALERTPNSLKRKADTPTTRSAKRLRSPAPSARNAKRCLVDLLNGTREPDEAESSVKRIKPDLPSIVEEEDRLLPAGIKRHICESSPTRCEDDWGYVSPKAGTSFPTPTENYEARNCKILSPKNLKNVSPGERYGSPEEAAEVRIVSFRTPTKDLPNYVMSGEAPHLGLMSPVRKKHDTTDWLTLIAREKRGKRTELGDKPPAPSSPKENIPARRNSVTDKTPKSNKRARTLLKYFNVATKGK